MKVQNIVLLTFMDTYTRKLAEACQHGILWLFGLHLKLQYTLSC